MIEEIVKTENLEILNREKSEPLPGASVPFH